MSQRISLSKTRRYQHGLASTFLLIAMSAHAAPSVSNTDSVATSSATNQNTSVQSTSDQTLSASNTLAAQIQPSDKALSEANQALLSRNAQLQRQVNDLQTQVNVLVYESKGQLFLYGAFTVLMSLLVGIFISWLVFVRRERW
ncbi:MULTISPECIES: hypothetical protein [unclassified Psychrobacter]|uniref:hypothetical protein n=1 Tax=unclassified Psychrobacter TaxID=196806 RepID=UPI003F47F371